MIYIFLTWDSGNSPGIIYGGPGWSLFWLALWGQSSLSTTPLLLLLPRSSKGYFLIKELKNHYNLEDFFSIKVESYKPLAALYCLLEAQNTQGLVDPQVFVDNKTTLLEHFLQTKQDGNNAKDTLIEEYSKYDKDLRLLTYKILLEKFNNKYDNLLPEQKNILKEFIISANSTTKLRTIVNEELGKIQVQITKLKPRIEDQIVKIKLDEISKSITPVKNTEKVTDNHLVSLMQYYELVGELKRVWKGRN